MRASELLLMALLLQACAGKGTGLDANGRPIGANGGSGGPVSAEFQSIQDTVFTPICTVCHAGAGAPQGLRLDSANSFNLLVNVPSTEVPGIVRIKPGDPDNSYLIQKIEGHAAVGGQMPLGGPPLAAEVIAAMRQWVTDGAQPAVAQAVPAVFKMLSSAPAPGDVLIEPPPQVMIGFNQPLDATRVDPDSLRLERMDDSFAPALAEPVAARLSLPVPNAQSLLLTPQRRLRPGHYRVLLRVASGSALTDWSARSLIIDTPVQDEQSILLEFDVQGAP